MSIPELTNFLGRMTLINIGILIFSFVFVLVFIKLLYRFYGRIFNLTEENIAQVIFKWLATYELFIIVFNLVPFLALDLM